MKRQQGDRRERLGDGKHSLVTERDIDPKFGLFTEEESGETMMDAAAELRRLNPDNRSGRQSE